MSTFDLSVNKLTGPIPLSFDGLVNLQSVSLYNNQLSGSLTEGLGNWVKIQTLRLQNNQFSGPLPSGFGNMHNAQYIDFSNNFFTGLIPKSIGTLAKISTFLQYLSFEGNQFSCPLPCGLVDAASCQPSPANDFNCPQITIPSCATQCTN